MPGKKSPYWEERIVCAFKERRRYYRHPIEFPIYVRETHMQHRESSHTKDISEGGLYFLWKNAIPSNEVVDIAIPVHDQVFSMRARVAYSRRDGKTGQFHIGLAFEDAPSVFRAKLAEEMIQIKKYREKMRAHRGRDMSEEEAAKEWVAHNGERFAKLFSCS